MALDLLNEAGAVADVTTRPERVGFNILVGFISSPGKDNVGRCSFLGEALDPAVTAAELQERLDASKFAMGVSVKASHQGILVDSLNFPLRWNSGDRAVMLRTEFFAKMKQKARVKLQSGADVLLYELGYENGIPSWKNLLSNYNVRDSGDLEEILQVYSAVGWGRIQVVSFDKASKKAFDRMGDNFECSGLRGGVPTSHFVRGHLAGAFSIIFGAAAKVEETSCVASGASYCEFAIHL